MLKYMPPLTSKISLNHLNLFDFFYKSLFLVKLLLYTLFPYSNMKIHIQDSQSIFSDTSRENGLLFKK